ncbi:MAG TPA: molybdopterin-binding protein [Casimicrobiaceae bacterium]|nr:molybdopterin-binding protein [Casimicrobiaceae bacterium]
MRIGALIIGDELLSGKRSDAHLAHVIATLASRGLKLDYATYLGDDRARIVEQLQQSFARADLVFSFGGIGATPDDHTRQAAAAALGVALERHPEAVASIEAQFGEGAYPHRVLMAEFPARSTIVPNPVNRVAAFSIRDHHFLPGFPQMAWPMMDWVLATHYPSLQREPDVERTLIVHDAGESQLVPLMNENVARYPRVRLFSLPSFVGEGRRRIELGVRGAASDVDEAFAHLVAGVAAAGFPAQPVAGGRRGAR